jgi:hypothetical protein
LGIFFHGRLLCREHNPPYCRFFLDKNTREPSWEWALPRGVLTFKVLKGVRSGFRLIFEWKGEAEGFDFEKLEIEPLITASFEVPWQIRRLQSEGFFQIDSESDGPSLFLKASPGTIWRDEALQAQSANVETSESVFSRGKFVAKLGVPFELILTDNEKEHHPSVNFEPLQYAGPIEDFILIEPPGVVAAFPGLGEWGRDTFISLPGIAARIAGKQGAWSWIESVFARWGVWIHLSGMLPNFLREGGDHQWESADATLWWCHSLASLFLASEHGGELRGRFSGTLNRAIATIENGGHLYLRKNRNGLLEVTEPFSTWMDSREVGRGAMPRTGILPEINALWFQARCLQWLWDDLADPRELLELGYEVLSLVDTEKNRPNSLFLHSLPLSPFFVMRAATRNTAEYVKILEMEREDLMRLKAEFWTPQGLRSLSPGDPHYHGHYEGSSQEREQAFHQGTVWGWTYGHFEMAKFRLFMAQKLDLSGRTKHRMDDPNMSSVTRIPPRLDERELLELEPEQHINEIFDADPPYLSRGASAHAASLACRLEARARIGSGSDERLERLLTERFAARGQRPSLTGTR